MSVFVRIKSSNIGSEAVLTSWMHLNFLKHHFLASKLLHKQHKLKYLFILIEFTSGSEFQVKNSLFWCHDQDYIVKTAL